MKKWILMLFIKIEVKMCKVAILAGSHSIRNSVSMYIGKEISKKLKDKDIELLIMTVNSNFNDESIRNIVSATVLIIISPIYVDAPSSKLLKILKKIIKYKEDNNYVMPNKKMYVYAISNCGFYEPEHNECALNIYECFARKISAEYVCGLGIGCGQLLTNFNSKFLSAPITKALAEIVDSIVDICRLNRTDINDYGKNRYVKMRIIKPLYIVVVYLYWHLLGKKNGLKKADYYYYPYKYNVSLDNREI